MAEPSLSVITPSFEQGDFLERTVRSVVDQEVPGLEYLVVDGGSRDGSLDVLRRFAGRLRWISEPDDGQADAVNKGIAATRGEIVGWLNSDDVYEPGALAAVRRFFAAHPEVDVVYGEAHHIDEHDAVLGPYKTEPWDRHRLEEVCFLCQPAVFFRRCAVERWGLLDARLRYCMDYELWLRLAGRGARFAHLRRPLAGSRLYPGNKTLGERVRVHGEINHMLRRTLGAVPDRWLSNFAHVSLEERGLRREAGARFVLGVAILSWLAALYWNGSVSRSLRRTTGGWIRGCRGGAGRPDPAAKGSAPRPASPARPRLRAVPDERPLRVGFDVSQTGPGKTGCGYLADSLVQALAELPDGGSFEYVLYPTLGPHCWHPDGPGGTRRIDRPGFRRGLTHPSHRAARAFWRDPPADLEARLGDPDVVHSHNFFCPPGLKRARLVYTLHDLGFLVHPEWTSEANRQLCFDGVFRASLEADLVVAVSEATRRHFLATFPHYPEARTAVVHLASRFAGDGAAERPAALTGLEAGRFLLAVGTLEPRKNPLALLRAYAGYARRRVDPWPLVLAGGDGWRIDGLGREIERLGLGERVIRLGYVDDAALLWLYRSCAVFLYPSLFEGFGLPVVEAMSQGAAIITSSCSSLPEVAGDAALLVDPRDETALERALLRLVDDPALRADLGARAALRARRFAWEKAARQLLACYRRVVECPKLAAVAPPVAAPAVSAVG